MIHYSVPAYRSNRLDTIISGIASALPKGLNASIEAERIAHAGQFVLSVTETQEMGEVIHRTQRVVRIPFDAEMKQIVHAVSRLVNWWTLVQIEKDLAEEVARVLREGV